MKDWDFISSAQASFPKLMIARVETTELCKVAKTCAWRTPVLLQPSLYEALKLTFPTDIGGIVLHGRITSDVGSGNLGQSVGFFCRQISGQYMPEVYF